MNAKTVFVIFFCALVPACSHGAEEDRAVLAAVEELRDSAPADISARRGMIEKLEKLPASSPLAQSTRDDCVKAYRALLDAKEATAKLKRVFEDPNASGKDIPTGPAGLDELIKRSEEAMPACDKAAADLSLAHH